MTYLNSQEVKSVLVTEKCPSVTEFLCHTISNANHMICKVLEPLLSTFLCFLPRFLGAGETLRSSSFNFMIGRSTCWGIVSEVCTALWEVLGPLLRSLSGTARGVEKGMQFFTRANKMPQNYALVSSFTQCLFRTWVLCKISCITKAVKLILSC